MATDENRKHRITDALVNGHEALYHSSAIFKSKIEMMAHLIPLLVDDMAASAEHEHVEFLERLAQERERHPMLLVREGEPPRPICGERSPSILVADTPPDFCALAPGHPGHHQASARFIKGSPVPGMRWTP
jgi:hypothetical protein